MTERVAATQTVVDAYMGQPFEWGRRDCARLAAAMLKALGHSPRVARFGRYSTPIGAVKALKDRGFADLAGVLDDLGLSRIPPAAALPGDILGFWHPELAMGFALMVAVGNGRALGFFDVGDGVPRGCVLAPKFQAEGGRAAAWRVAPGGF